MTRSIELADEHRERFDGLTAETMARCSHETGEVLTKEQFLGLLCLSSLEKLVGGKIMVQIVVEDR